MRKKALLEVYTIPASIILIVVLALVLLLIAKLLSATITVNERGGMADTALYAMLNSNDCTPNTKLAFKDVLGIGIAEGKKMREDTITLNYGGASDSITVGPPYTGSDPGCLAILRGRVIPAIPNLFYVEYSTCPGIYRRCFADATGTGTVPLNVESVEYIALPNGDVAKVVLKTAS